MLQTILIGAALMAVSFLPAGAQSKTSASLASLAAMRGRSRPLLIFHASAKSGSNSSDALVSKQLAMFDGHRAELKERDVEIVLVPNESAMGGNAAREDWASLRKKFHVEPGEITVILVGKDGGEKFRSHAPVTIEKLKALIDTMPMRQQEVQDGHSN